MAKERFNSPAVKNVHQKPYQAGDRVDIYCDHNQEGVRVRDWLGGVVVQADRKMVAVQFLEDVYLTNGWMVPDRVLWCLQTSDIIRPAARRRSRPKRK